MMRRRYGRWRLRLFWHLGNKECGVDGRGNKDAS